MLTISSFPRIVAPNDAPEAVRYAEKELRRCLGAVFGEAPACAGQGAGCSIYLLPRADDLPQGAFRWETDGNGIRLYSGTAQGMVYGVYALLEAMGCRFLARDAEVFPAPPLTLSPDAHREAPAFEARELFWREAMDGDFAVKLRLNSARSSITPRQGGKLMFYNFSHTFHQLVPEERYFDAHPEYFSMVNGRRLRERTQLCLTNPDVLCLCVEGVKKWARENPDCNIFSVAMNDWYQPCQCPACAKADEEEGSHAGTMIRFVNRVAEEAEKEFPGIMIHTFAYLYCRKPPLRTRPRDNVIVRLCSIECCFAHPMAACGCQTGEIDVQDGTARVFRGDKSDENPFVSDLKGWSRICKNLYIWDYTTNYANYLLPFPNLNAMQENLRLFRRYGVKGVFEQGNFSLGRASALGQLKIYLLAKWMWDPDLDGDTLIRDFTDGYYGPAAGPMRAYIDLWQNACGPDDHAGIYDSPAAGYLTEERLAAAWQILREALAAAQDAPWRERVKREALSVRYAQITRMPLDAPGRDALADAFAQDAKRLGITELFERRSLDQSFQAMKESRFAQDRSRVPSISYPI